MLQGYKTENTKFRLTARSKLGHVDCIYSDVDIPESEIKLEVMKYWNSSDISEVRSVEKEPFENGVHFQLIANRI